MRATTLMLLNTHAVIRSTSAGWKLTIERLINESGANKGMTFAIRIRISEEPILDYCSSLQIVGATKLKSELYLVVNVELRLTRVSLIAKNCFRGELSLILRVSEAGPGSYLNSGWKECLSYSVLKR